MKIEGIIWLRDVVDKLWYKHHVEIEEVEEVLCGKPKYRFVEKGDRKGENVYLALGRTVAGRYLCVLFIYKVTKEALILSARSMAKKERKQYEKK
ncbi:MAG: BrnT family toxin [Deltaproteobacteria bacterium]|uniref:BrnT family toxin n=1 Tax=Candidatus Desulfacyla euxinica TaxID=2841693 RepID=A0A8J6T8C0_9DELT|nr:BrnT family toxin [Candidatus Desulfacyla euxinica]